MRRHIRLFMLGTTFVAANMAAANAQPEQIPAGQDQSGLVLSDGPGQSVVVTGRRDVERQVRDFVDALTPAPPRGQLARFEAVACPIAGGSISETEKATVERRIRAIAEAVGIRVGDPSCVPNILVAVVPDKAEFIRGLWRRHRYTAFGSMGPRQIRRLASDPHPAAVWQFSSGFFGAHDINLEYTMGPSRLNRDVRASLATASARPVSFGSVVVVQDSAIPGLTPTQLADYAAMRIFARIDPSRLASSDVPSILRILNSAPDDEVPMSLTHWDLGFLRGLYSGPSNLYAASQRTGIRHAVEQQLERAANGD